MTQQEEIVVSLRDVSKHYVQKSVISSTGKRQRKQIVKAVDGVSLDIRRGEILGLIGEPGCGKSTLARLLISLEQPTSGDIVIDGINTKEIGSKQQLNFRRKVQLIFQNPYDIFDPRESIEQILMAPLKLHSIGQTSQERYSICLDILEQAGLKPAKDYISRYPHELSGGQLQRISILRSMLLEPSFVVADEPVTMLDVSIRADIINMLEELSQEQNASMVFISHDISTTRYISHKVAVMYLGRIVEYGETDDVLHNPIHPYTRALISNSASINPLEKKDIIRIDGEPPTPIGTGPGCYFEPRCYMRQERCKHEYPSATYVNGHQYSCFYAKKETNNEL